jgi:bacteriocin-like protein
MSEKNEKTGEKAGHPIPEKPENPKVTELSDKALEQVSGGTGQMIALNKQKSAQKAHDAMDNYIKQ